MQIGEAMKHTRRTAAAISIALALIAGSAGAAWAHGARGSRTSVPQGIDYPAGSLKDGVYEGTAVGYQPSLTVSVEVKGGRIASVRVTKNYETPRWWSAVANVIPKRIVKAQSTDIDAVSGATDSSYGIMSAVEDA